MMVIQLACEGGACGGHSHTAVSVGVLVILTAVVLAGLLIWKSASQGAGVRWLARVTSIALLGSLIWGASMLWQGVYIKGDRGINIACGTALGASQEPATSSDTGVKYECKQLGQLKVHAAVTRGGSAVAVPAVAFVCASVVTLWRAMSSRTVA
jgi:hypothetical protein